MPARPLPQKPSAAWLQEGYGHIWMPYTQMQTAPLPQAAVATEGTRIILSEGTQLIDGVSSWWSACHGYNHPHIIDAITAQAQQIEIFCLSAVEIVV